MKLEVEFCRQRAPDQDIFMKFGGFVGNEHPQGVEWSKHVTFKNPIWQTAAMHLA